jgi:hypothetical protein
MLRIQSSGGVRHRITGYVKDSGSGTWICLLQNGEWAKMQLGWSGFGSMNANLFIKERKENEFITGPLSSLSSVDIRAEISIKEAESGSGGIWIDFGYFDKNENEIDRWNFGKTGAPPYNFDMNFGNLEVLKNIQVYFWQIEFYFGVDTLRMPERPGMWCVVPNWRIVSD